MSPFQYALLQLSAFLAEVGRIKEAEFPYLQSRDALLIIESVLADLLKRLKRIGPGWNATASRNLGDKSITQISYYLPLLGFILRSTNPRNVFEVHGPLLRLAQAVLGTDTKLIISSEWDYSPFTYLGVANLPAYVFIGLPAPESANPLLIPLAGHELGHSVWAELRANRSFEKKLWKKIGERVFAAVKRHPREFKQIFRSNKIPKNAKAAHSDPDLRTAMVWASLQIEESFCDFVGLRIFGEAYLHATAYLLSNKIGENRSPQYPNVRQRITNLIKAAGKYSFKVPRDYINLFADLKGPSDLKERYLVLLADHAQQSIAVELVKEADSFLRRKIKTPDSRIARKILRDFELFVPAREPGGLANILNAAWLGFHSRSFKDTWRQRYIAEEENFNAILKELVLKSIEVLEIAQRTQANG